MWLVWAQRKITKIILTFKKKLITDDTEAKDQTCILDHIKDFYEALFRKCEQKTTAKTKYFLNAINVPKLYDD